MKRLNSYKHNVLLLKDDVGKSKPNTRTLPDSGFFFGNAIYRDAEDAGQGKYHTLKEHIMTQNFSDIAMELLER